MIGSTNVQRKMECFKRAAYVGALVLGLTAGNAPAAVITHSGSADPVTEGFVIGQRGGAIPAVSSGPGSENGIDYWEIDDNRDDQWRNYEHQINPADLTDPTGWTYTVAVRVVDAPTDLLSVALYIRDGQSRWMFSLVGGPNATKDPGIYRSSTTSTLEHLLSMETADAYHVYQIVYNPLESTDAIDLYVDGQLQLTVGRSDAVNDANAPSLLFGSISRDHASVSRWSLVQFEVGQHVIPEPGTATLLGVGGALAFVRRRVMSSS